MPRGLWGEVASIAFRQQGLVTRAQLLAVGLSEQAIFKRICSGALQVLHPTVYRLAGVPESWDQSLLAAVLAAGHPCAISNLAAAAFWRFEGIKAERTHIVVPHARRLALSRVVVHRTRFLPDNDVTTRGGLYVTTPARTLLDIAGVVARLELEVALDDCLRRRIATLEQLRVCLSGRGPNGVNGWRRVDELVTEREGTEPTGSGKETRFRRGLLARGLPLPVAQYRINDAAGRLLARVDFAYPDIKLAIEVDSPPHADRRRWESDLSRQNRVILEGWRFLRFPRTDRAGQRRAFEVIEAAFAAFGEPGATTGSARFPQGPKERDAG